MSKFTVEWKRISPTPSTSDEDKFLERSSHGVSAVATGDDRTTICVWGGEHMARHVIDSEMWVLDIVDGDSKGGWRVLQTKSAKPAPRFAHGQAVVDGNIYVFGGRQGITMDEAPLNDMHKFDVSTATWSPVTYVAGEPPSKRSFHRMISVGAVLYVFGGCDGEHGRCSDLFSFDTTTGVWRELPKHVIGGNTVIRGRGGPNLCASADGKRLFVIAGFAGEETNDAYSFDLATEEWVTLAPGEFRPRSVCVSATFDGLGGTTGGVVCVVGGEVDESAKGHEGAGEFAGDVVLFSGDTGALLETPALIGSEIPPRGWSMGAMLGSNGLVVVGGLAGSDANPLRLGDVWRLAVTESGPKEDMEEKKENA
jgi:hypothetical protein